VIPYGRDDSMKEGGPPGIMLVVRHIPRKDHGEPRGHFGRGSIRGLRFAGNRLKVSLARRRKHDDSGAAPVRKRFGPESRGDHRSLCWCAGPASF
jgi:hypothetical protein